LRQHVTAFGVLAHHALNTAQLTLRATQAGDQLLAGLRGLRGDGQ
jgi:hypothetical protein